MLKNQRGGAAVEFAIALPLLAIILFGTIDFALLFYNKQVLTNASREGARSAIVEDHQTSTGFPNDQIDIIKDYCANHLINFNGSTSLTTDPTITPTSTGGTYYTATVTCDYQHLFGSLDFLSSAFGISKTTTITGQTVMRSE